MKKITCTKVESTTQQIRRNFYENIRGGQWIGSPHYFFMIEKCYEDKTRTSIQKSKD